MRGKAWRWSAVLVFIAAVVMALRLIGPAVPHEISMLTGPEDTTFFEDGLRYKEILSRYGIAVHLEQTSGSAENLNRLIEAEVPTAAFVWGLPDTTGQDMAIPEGVESLGTMLLQPVWIFTSKGADITRLRDLSGSRVEAGEKGSDSRLLAFFLLREEGIDDDMEFAQDLLMTPDQVQDAIQNDQVGAIIAVGEPDSPLIDALLRSPKLQVLSIQRAEAFAMKFPALQSFRFPRGGHDLGANIPDHDLQLLAARAQLLVSDLFPPALADLLLQAASEIQGDGTAFSARGEFPSRESAPLPLSRAADNFYTNGPSKLQKFLPFRLATLINRFLVAAVAIGSAAITIFKLLPALITLPFRLRMRHGYSELRALEKSAAAGADQKTLLAELAKLDQWTASIRLPIHKVDSQWIELRQFLHDMRDRLTTVQEE